MALNVHDCKTELNKVSLRVTPARLAVMELLEKSDKPLNLADINSYLEKKGVNADPATSFRIINLFTKKGITKKLQFLERKFRYELASKKHHHHLICLNCEKIQDIKGEFMAGWESEIREKKRFLVINHNLEFFGICNSCQKHIQQSSV